MDDIIDLLRIKIEKAKKELPEDTLNAINAVDWRDAILHLREKKGYSFEQLGDLELETELLLAGLVSVKDYPRELEKRMNISKMAANELVREMNEQVFSKIKEELIKSTERKKIFGKSEMEIETPVRDTFAKPPSHDSIEEKNKNRSVLNSAGIDIILEKQVGPSERENQMKNSLPTENQNMGVTRKPSISNGENIIPAGTVYSGNKALPDLERLELTEGPKSKLEKKPVALPVDGRAPIEETHPMLAQKLGSSFQIPSKKTEYSLNNISKTGSIAGISSPLPTETPKTAPAIYPPKGDPYRMTPEEE